MKNYIKALREFVQSIDEEATWLERVTDEVWFDLALAYADAKKALNTAPILLRRDGPEKQEGLRPYDIILQEFPDEYCVTRLYTDDIGGYDQGYYFPFPIGDQGSALRNAIKQYQQRYY